MKINSHFRILFLIKLKIIRHLVKTIWFNKLKHKKKHKNNQNGIKIKIKINYKSIMIWTNKIIEKFDNIL